MNNLSICEANPLCLLGQNESEQPLWNPASPWLAFMQKAERARQWNNIGTVYFRNGRWIVRRAMESQDISTLIRIRDLRDRMLAMAPHIKVRVGEMHRQDRVGRMEDWAIYDFDADIKVLCDQLGCLHSKTG